MKLVLIGDFRKIRDEGMRNLSLDISDMLKDRYEILRCSTKEFITFESLRKIKNFNPDILHYITGPTIRSLFSLAIYKKMLGANVKTVSSGIRPYLSFFGRHFLKYYRPDYYLSQSTLWEQLFSSAGSKCISVPNFVDTMKFAPVTDLIKKKLRNKYSLPVDKKIFLHVGHIKKNRNLEILVELQRKTSYQVVIIGSSSFSKDTNIKDQLINSGCVLLTEYLPNIEEFYQLSDYYIFPVNIPYDGAFPKGYNSVGVIDFPLSILEALACNLPVISTYVETLERYLGNKQERIKYFSGKLDDLISKVNSFKYPLTNSSEIIERFDKKVFLDKLINFYNSI